MSEDKLTLFQHAEAEIVGLHRFFANWYNADKADKLDFSRFERAIGEGFRMVVPDSGKILDREAVLAYVRNNRGSFHGEFIIEIEDVSAGWEADDVIVVTYIEAQFRGGQWSRRRASALFSRSSSAPNGVEWRHLQETWLQMPEADGFNSKRTET
ncbi:MAG: hypothetical protein KGI75_22610 [Rhizobiaceae bacterium]|nr:hypothetical protein [Rhizobiaceae bacterium]